MRTIHKWTLGVAALATLAGVAWAQVPTTRNLAGTEIVRAALPGGGSDIAVPSYVLRSGGNYTLVATGTTVNTAARAQDGNLIATGAITTWNVTLPASPFTGQTIGISCPGGDVTTLAISAATTPASTTLVGTNPTSCTASTATASTWQYSTSANKWYRIQ